MSTAIARDSTPPLPQQSPPAETFPPAFEALVGRLIEISGPRGSPTLSTAMRLLLEAQMAGEPVAWVSARTDMFFAPDVAENGIDLDALAVIRVPDTHAAARAADKLLRSGAFGLVVIDADDTVLIPPPLVGRLTQLSYEHSAAVLLINRKSAAVPSLSPLVSLRVESSRVRLGSDRFAVTVTTLKDKRGGPGAAATLFFRGPSGLH